jgi:hypothetical protein
MLTHVSSPLTRVATVILFAISFGACGSSLEGIYAGGDNSFFERLTVKADHKVEVTFMGMTKEGTYAVEGQKVKITVGAETQVFTLDEKECLHGGGLLGTYCKGDQRAAVRGHTNGPLSGTYRAGDQGESITLEFRDGRTVHMTLAESGINKDVADATYDVSGDRVTITFPGGIPLTLTRKGHALEGAFDGRRVTFVKQ